MKKYYICSDFESPKGSSITKVTQSLDLKSVIQRAMLGQLDLSTITTTGWVDDKATEDSLDSNEDDYLNPFGIERHDAEDLVAKNLLKYEHEKVKKQKAKADAERSDKEAEAEA